MYYEILDISLCCFNNSCICESFNSVGKQQYAKCKTGVKPETLANRFFIDCNLPHPITIPNFVAEIAHSYEEDIGHLPPRRFHAKPFSELTKQNKMKVVNRNKNMKSWQRSFLESFE